MFAIMSKIKRNDENHRMFIGIRSLLKLLHNFGLIILLKEYHKVINVMWSFTCFVYNWDDVVYNVDVHYCLFNYLLNDGWGNY